MVVPVGASSFSEAVRMGAEIFHTLKKILEEKNLPTTVGDEGGFAPALSDNEKGMTLLIEAITKAGFTAGKDVYLAADIAASELFGDNTYHFRAEEKTLGPEALLARYKDWTERFPLISIEDPFEQNDWENTAHLTEAIGSHTQIVGDDLFCTNTERLAEGISKKAGNAILVKMNQIGTISETIAVIDQAQMAGYHTIISHRSGETEDTSIAHLAVGTGAGQIKTGSLSRSERVAKYNELLRIEESLGTEAHYAGRSILPSNL
jgi:enolase